MDKVDIFDFFKLMDMGVQVNPERTNAETQVEKYYEDAGISTITMQAAKTDQSIQTNFLIKGD